MDLKVEDFGNIALRIRTREMLSGVLSGHNHLSSLDGESGLDTDFGLNAESEG